jgi:excisionase family DNA binding protein
VGVWQACSLPIDNTRSLAMPVDTLTESTSTDTPTTAVKPRRRLTDTAPPPPATYDVRDLAALLNISIRQVWRMCDAGKMPKPARFGRAVRWSRSVIDKWLAAGAAPCAKGR